MHRPVVTILICALVAACTSQDAGLSTHATITDTLPGGIVRVTNNGPSEWSDTNGWKLVLERTLAPAAGSPGELLEPRWLLLRDDGALVVGDMEPPRFAWYDSTGSFVRTLGREGDGPGEFRSPHPALLGDTLIVHDPQQSRITLLTLADSFVRAFPSICCYFGPPAFVDRDGLITVQSSRRVEGGPSLPQWVRFDLSGQRLDSLLQPQAVAPAVWILTQTFPGGGSGTSTRYIPLAPQSSVTLLHDGTAVFGRTDLPTFAVVRNGTDTVRIFGRSDVTPDPAPAGMRDSLFEAVTKQNAKMKDVASISDIPSTLPTWRAIDEDGAGNLWVTVGGEGRPIRFDVYDPSGRLLGTVPRPWGATWASSWAGDRVAILDTDGDDLPRIRIYHIER
ncbi:MAG TPA: hypothetical protein VFN22_07130 [Gemmatimonadales bacterium]|nr:hypothetical protein [Gemmatimonadales bacterium]